MRVIKNAAHLSLFVAATALASAASGAVVLEINGSGQLTGARNLDVLGTVYDVAFVDGTCAAAFAGCGSVFNFAFPSNVPGATAAGQALLDTVFLDTASGMFDSAPNLIAGCTDTFECHALIPTNIAFDAVFGYDAVNFRQGIGYLVSTFNPVAIAGDLSTVARQVWAVFTPAAPVPVPEPTTVALFA
ncbi:MAG TPA: hypothetical protein VFX89_14815, partial [Gammaproteobacteria bacterium]|nr:hypothetical protein [Gammaproteobacteria bacterium]